MDDLGLLLDIILQFALANHSDLHNSAFSHLLQSAFCALLSIGTLVPPPRHDGVEAWKKLKWKKSSSWWVLQQIDMALLRSF
jgi:hypothetical protein